MSQAIQIVKQTDDYGCLAACAATVLNRSYADVAKDFGHDFKSRGLNFDRIIVYLNEQGFDVIQKRGKPCGRVDFARDELLKPFAPVHIVSLREFSDSDTHHSVVMDADGKLHDPAGETEETLKKAYQVVQVIGLFK